MRLIRRMEQTHVATIVQIISRNHGDEYILKGDVRCSKKIHDGEEHVKHA